MKTCFKCGGEKDFSEFYKHKYMGDGYLGKCKECTKKDVRENRKDNLQYYREYDRNRGNRQTPEYYVKYRAEKPNAYKAITLVNNAIRDKKLFKKPCEKCKTMDNIHAHHDDYLQPLNVRWLCAGCHSQWHKVNGPGLNA